MEQEKLQNNILQASEDYLQISRYKRLGVKNYVELGGVFYSLLCGCQSLLFAEVEDSKKEEIYTLLELLKKLLPEQEFEFLDLLYKEYNTI